MRNFFFAKSVPSGEVWREVMGAIVITFVAHYIGFVMTEVIRRINHVSYGDAAGTASGIAMILLVCLLRVLGFRLLAVFIIAMGVGLIILAPYPSSAWLSAAEWIGGFVLIVRGFSERRALHAPQDVVR